MNRVPLARILRAHGVRGELRVKLYNAASRTLAPGLQVALCRDGAVLQNAEVLTLRPVKDAVLLRLDTVGDRNAADALRGVELQVEASDLPALEEDEFYAVELEGCAVIDAHGQRCGEVIRLSDNGAHDLLHVRHEGHEWLLPLVERWVRRVDLEAREVHAGEVEALIALARGEG